MATYNILVLLVVTGTICIQAGQGMPKLDFCSPTTTSRSEADISTENYPSLTSSKNCSCTFTALEQVSINLQLGLEVDPATSQSHLCGAILHVTPPTGLAHFVCGSATEKNVLKKSQSYTVLLAVPQQQQAKAHVQFSTTGALGLAPVQVKCQQTPLQEAKTRLDKCACARNNPAPLANQEEDIRAIKYDDAVGIRVLAGAGTTLFFITMCGFALIASWFMKRRRDSKDPGSCPGQTNTAFAPKEVKKDPMLAEDGALQPLECTEEVHVTPLSAMPENGHVYRELVTSNGNGACYKDPDMYRAANRGPVNGHVRKSVQELEALNSKPEKPPRGRKSGTPTGSCSGSNDSLNEDGRQSQQSPTHTNANGYAKPDSTHV